MTSFSLVSIFCLIFYLFLLMAFSLARRNKIIRSFMLLLVFLTLSTGGSFFMRTRSWPSVSFWHYVSLAGILMVPAAFFRFITDFIDGKTIFRNLWFLIFGVVFVVNLKYSFIPTPMVVTEDPGMVRFVYHYGSRIYIVLAISTVLVLQLCVMVYRSCRGNFILFQQIRPILIGMLVVIGGAGLSTASFAEGIPVDLLSGVLCAYLLFYALNRKQLFRLSLLNSPLSCYVTAVIVSMGCFYFYCIPLSGFLKTRVHSSEAAVMLLVMGSLILSSVGLYLVMKLVLNLLFAKNEQTRTEMLQSFSQSVSKTLDKDVVLDSLLESIHRIIPVTMAYACLKNKNGDFRLEKSLSALHSEDFSLRADHPLVQYLQSHDEGILLQDFCHSKEYLSLWEAEKQKLKGSTLPVQRP